MPDSGPAADVRDRGDRGQVARDNGLMRRRCAPVLPRPVLARPAVWLAAAAAWLALGCSPRLDWRDVRADGLELAAQMPCRPSTHARTVALGGGSREMVLLTCSAGDATWGLAWVAGVEPAWVVSLTEEWRRVALSNVAAGSVSPLGLAVPGATPNPQAGRWRASGRRPDGSAVTQEIGVFSRGTTVYQATVLSTQPEPAAAEQFFGALRFPDRR